MDRKMALDLKQPNRKNRTDPGDIWTSSELQALEAALVQQLL